MKHEEPIVIIEYIDSYKSQVVDLIGEGLVDQSVIPASSLPVGDDDLQKIPQVYDGRSKFWIALSNGVVVGTVGILAVEELTAKLKRMFVKKEFRGTGLGKRMLDTALQFARAAGYTKIILNTHKKMERAHHFYRKNGFTFVGVKKKDSLTFEKVL